MHTEATIASGRQKLTHFYEHLAVGNPLFYFTHLISSKSFLYRYTLLLRIIMTQRPKNGIFPRSIPYSISLMTLLLRGWLATTIPSQMKALTTHWKEYISEQTLEMLLNRWATPAYKKLSSLYYRSSTSFNWSTLSFSFVLKSTNWTGYAQNKMQTQRQRRQISSQLQQKRDCLAFTLVLVNQSHNHSQSLQRVVGFWSLVFQTSWKHLWIAFALWKRVTIKCKEKIR